MNLLKTLATAVCALSITLSAAASSSVKGLWTKTPVSRPSSVTQIVETPDAVWYIGGGTLHRYDRTSGDVSLYGIDQGLNTDYTSKISYNASEGYLVAVMLEGLLNIIHDDGIVIPVNDIAKVRATRSSNINAVALSGNDIYVATDFGIAIVDATTGHLKKAGVYPTITSGSIGASGGPSAICIIGDWIYATWDPYIYGAPLSSDLSTATAWTQFTGTSIYTDTASYGMRSLFPLSDTSFMVEYDGGISSVYYRGYKAIVPDTSTFTYTSSVMGLSPQTYQRAWVNDGTLYMTYVKSGESYISLCDYSDPTAGVTATRQLFDNTAPMFTAVSASPYASTVWIADADGLTGYEYASDGSRTVSVTPEQTAYKGTHTTVANISMLRPTPDGTGLLITTRSDTYSYLENAGKFYNPDVEPYYNVMGRVRKDSYITPYNVLFGVEPAFFVTGYVNLMQADGTIIDFSPKQALNKQGTFTYTESNNIWPFTADVYRVMLQQPIMSPNAIALNPASELPEIYVNTNNEGLYCLKLTESGEIEQTILSNRLNNLLSGGWYNQGKDVRFDDEGNLWVVGVDCWAATTIRDDSRRRSLNMLPAAKLAAGGFTNDDWIEPDCLPATRKLCGSEWTIKVDAQLWLINNPQGKYMAINPQRGVGKMPLYYRASTGADTSDDKMWTITTLLTQYGESISLTYTNALYSDSKGRLWIQTDRFFGYVDDFSKLADGDSELDAVKVSQGSISDAAASDLLPGVQIVAMSEAPDGTLWVATQTTGLYQISADGTEVLDHYDSNNSPLPSDVLGAVCVLADGNVHVGTRHGLYTLTPGKAAAAADLDNVAVAPSPVPAGYTGHFTISNLTADAPVRVSTLPEPSKGTVLFDGTAAGGAITWDGLDSNGARVAPGTYYVHAGSPLTPVAKIVIID